MAFNLTDFRSSFSNNGEPSSPANYEVSVTRKPQAGFASNTNLTMEKLLPFRCISCSLPGKMMNTIERSTYGPNRKVVTSSLYQDVTFSFIVSDDKSELDYFNVWQNYIVDNNVDSSSSANNHDVRYYDEYVGDIKISHLDKQNEIKYTISLLEAYPISVEEIPLSWENNNEFIRVNVTVAYRNWVKII